MDAEKFVGLEIAHQPLAISELGDLAAGVHQHDLLEAIVDLGVLDRLANGASPVPVDSSSRREPGNRLSTISVPVALRPTSTVSPSRIFCSREVSGTVGDLDREELQRLLVIGARHAVGAEQGPAVDLQSHHRELAVLEAEPGVAGGGEAEQGVGPMVDGKNLLFIEGAHTIYFSADPALLKRFGPALPGHFRRVISHLMQVHRFTQGPKF